MKFRSYLVQEIQQYFKVVSQQCFKDSAFFFNFTFKKKPQLHLLLLQNIVVYSPL